MDPVVLGAGSESEDGEKGIEVEVTEGFGQKAEVAVPEKMVRANSEIGIKANFQS